MKIKKDFLQKMEKKITGKIEEKLSCHSDQRIIIIPDIDLHESCTLTLSTLLSITGVISKL